MNQSNIYYHFHRAHNFCPLSISIIFYHTHSASHTQTRTHTHTQTHTHIRTHTCTKQSKQRPDWWQINVSVAVFIFVSTLSSHQQHTTHTLPSETVLTVSGDHKRWQRTTTMTERLGACVCLCVCPSEFLTLQFLYCVIAIITVQFPQFSPSSFATPCPSHLLVSLSLNVESLLVVTKTPKNGDKPRNQEI